MEPASMEFLSPLSPARGRSLLYSGTFPLLPFPSASPRAESESSQTTSMPPDYLSAPSSDSTSYPPIYPMSLSHPATASSKSTPSRPPYRSSSSSSLCILPPPLEVSPSTVPSTSPDETLRGRTSSQSLNSPLRSPASSLPSSPSPKPLLEDSPSTAIATSPERTLRGRASCRSLNSPLRSTASSPASSPSHPPSPKPPLENLPSTASSTSPDRTLRDRASRQYLNSPLRSPSHSPSPKPPLEVSPPAPPTPQSRPCVICGAEEGSPSRTLICRSKSPDWDPSNDDPATPTSTAAEVLPPTIDYSGANPFGKTTSAAKQEWELLKLNESAENSAIDELMGLVGLEEVKSKVLDINAKVATCKRQGADLKRERFNIVFQGNPGTGKTTVARIYANFLKSCGVLPEGGLFKETSAASLAYREVHGAKKKLKKIMEQGGGVLFVDEAYQLTAPHTSAGGRQVLDYILAKMENNIGKLTLIFVGYNQEMQSFFEHNPGLASRIPYTLQFSDFSEGELWNILCDGIDRRYGGKMKVEDGMDGLFMRIAIRRLAHGRGIRGFGNARSVHNLLARVAERQAKRLTKGRKEGIQLDDFYLTKEDLIGPDPSEALFESAAWNRLQDLIGLDEVKATAQTMIDMIQTNYRRELHESPPLGFPLNRVFFGSPGTGKTTVAKLFGQILADLGLLSNGEVVVRNPSNFIGEALGKSEAKTRAILAATTGKVLIIDEAYMLDYGGTGSQGDAYKMAVVDTLVAEVQSVLGDDRCILLLGYEDKLKEMFHNVNPGLSRRFAIDEPFNFLNYDLLQLEKILVLKMRERHLSATEGALKVALEILDRARMRPNFCNAGEVDNCLNKATLNYQTRQSKKPVGQRDFNCVIEPEDFDPDFARSSQATENCRAALQGKVGEDIILAIQGYQQRAIAAKIRGLDPRKEIPTKFVFKGPPGTGKTTTALNMGQVYYDLGLLSKPQVIECSASDLIGQYVGHTSPKTKKLLDLALGKVLFVDEAFRLTEGQYANEAVHELIHLLNKPRYDGKMVVILAGYTQDMNQLMSAKPNLSSLFSDEIVFRNINPVDCLTLLDRELTSKRINAPCLKDSATADYRKLMKLVQVLAVFPTWSNARDIQKLAKDISGSAPSGITTAGLSTKITTEQVVVCLKRMIKMCHERCGSHAGQKGKRHHIPAASQSLQFAGGPIVAQDEAPFSETDIEISVSSAPITRARAKDVGIFLEQNSSPPSPTATFCLRKPPGAGPIREAGVSDEIWDRLQANKTAQAQDQGLKAAENQRGKRGQAIQDKLNQMGVCEAGYQWTREGGGYRCEGGAHFVPDSQLILS